MKRFVTLLAAAVLSLVLLPAASHAQQWPAYGSVTSSHPWATQATSASYPWLAQTDHAWTPHMEGRPVYTPGYSFSNVAANGAIHYYYVPGHAYSPNDNGPLYYHPAFRSKYEQPGHIYYYYGSYGNPNAFYDNRR